MAVATHLERVGRTLSCEWCRRRRVQHAAAGEHGVHWIPQGLWEDAPAPAWTTRSFRHAVRWLLPAATDEVRL